MIIYSMLSSPNVPQKAHLDIHIVGMNFQLGIVPLHEDSHMSQWHNLSL
jgi:hypothetical protein